MYFGHVLSGVGNPLDSTVTSHTIRPYLILSKNTEILVMEIKVENTLENNCQCLDKVYRSEIIEIPEKIDHVTTLGSIAKLGLKPVNVSAKN